MSNLRQAAQQALEDLQDANGMAYSEFSVEDLYGETITALRAALAEPEQIAAHGCHIDLEPGQSADACVFDDGRIEDCDYAWKLQREGKGKEACAEWRPIKLIKPTPRKPLSEQQIDELSRTMVKGDKSVNWLCRAVEAAHGITGEGT